MNIKRVLAKNYANFRGWSSKKKYIVIESDDWGSIRMPSKEVYDFLLKKGVGVDKSYFTKYDCLESNDDVELLFDVLAAQKDNLGNYPVITAMTIMANPDFEKIIASSKKEYHYELLTDTYKKYPNHSKVMSLWKGTGIKENLLWPQFHGREHMNVKKWIRAINAGNENENLAFDNKVILGLRKDRLSLTRGRFDYMAGFEYEDDEHIKEIEEITIEGLNIFEDKFGFRSKSFAASSSIRGEHLDKVLSENGVLYHQLGQQFIPQLDGSVKRINRFWGDMNEFGQSYWRRNAMFEPSRSPDDDWVNKCLKDIEVAFRWGKPAVINSHRVNFSSGISTANRDNTLKLLSTLLKKVLLKWPDVEFINSQQLGDVISGNRI